MSPTPSASQVASALAKAVHRLRDPEVVAKAHAAVAKLGDSYQLDTVDHWEKAQADVQEARNQLEEEQRSVRSARCAALTFRARKCLVLTLDMHVLRSASSWSV